MVFELYRHFDITLATDKEWTVCGHWFTPQSDIQVNIKPKSQANGTAL